MPTSEVLLFGWKLHNYLAARLDLDGKLKNAFPREHWRLGVTWAPDLDETNRILKTSRTIDILYFSNDVETPHTQLVSSIYTLAKAIQARSDKPAVIFAKGFDTYGQYFKFADVEISRMSAAEIVQAQWRRRVLLTLARTVVDEDSKEKGRE